MVPPGLDQARVQVDQVSHFHRRGPGAVVVMHHQRDHRGQPARPGMVGQVAVPDPHDVAQHPERHHRVVAALMFDQYVDECFSAVQWRGEQQIGMPPP